MSGQQIDLECPSCGHSERTALVPTFRLGADLGVTVKRVDCSKCGYSGPPDGEGDVDG